MAPTRWQVGDFLLAGSLELCRVVIIGRHPAGLGHIEPGWFFRAEGQAVRLIQPIEDGHHRIGDAVAVSIRQGHHLPLGGEADQEVAIGVQGQDPGAWQIPGENGDGKARRQLQGEGHRIDGNPTRCGLTLLQGCGNVPGRRQDRRTRAPEVLPVICRGPQPHERQDDADDDDGFLHRAIKPRPAPGSRQPG